MAAETFIFWIVVVTTDSSDLKTSLGNGHRSSTARLDNMSKFITTWRRQTHMFSLLILVQPAKKRRLWKSDGIQHFCRQQQSTVFADRLVTQLLKEEECEIDFCYFVFLMWLLTSTFLELANCPQQWVTLGCAPDSNNGVKDATVLIGVRAVEHLDGQRLVERRISIQEGVQGSQVSWGKSREDAVNALSLNRN